MLLGCAVHVLDLCCFLLCLSYGMLQISICIVLCYVVCTYYIMLPCGISHCLMLLHFALCYHGLAVLQYILWTVSYLMPYRKHVHVHIHARLHVCTCMYTYTQRYMHTCTRKQSVVRSVNFCNRRNMLESGAIRKVSVRYPTALPLL